MERLTVCLTDKGRYSVRPIDWEGIWDKAGRIQETGFNHIGIFAEKEDAEFFAKTKKLEEDGKLIALPCKPGDTVYFLVNDGVNKPYIKPWKVRTISFCVEVIPKIGKTVFLTEQEALEVLEEMKHEKA